MEDNSKNNPVILFAQEEKSSRGLWFFILLLFAIVCLGFYVYSQMYMPLNPKAEERTFVVKSGENLNEIARNLEEEGIIKNHFYFIFYVLGKGFSGKLQAGDYLLSPAMTVSQITQKIKNGEVISREIIITIPEGFKISQIQERLRKNNLDFLISDFKVKDFKEDYKFLNNAPQAASLEGFLFPDTYKFSPEATASEIVGKMLNNFDKKLAPYRNEISGTGFTPYKIITMASLIEKEVKTFDDRQIVSGIFWKRLKEGRALESCASIAYILNVDKWRYSIEDTRKPSPYNTYLNPGLPPGPISNPGIDSIKAAIFPKDSPYNFFLTDPETGKTIFSKTLEEHNLNKARYFK